MTTINTTTATIGLYLVCRLKTPVSKTGHLSLVPRDVKSRDGIVLNVKAFS